MIDELKKGRQRLLSEKSSQGSVSVLRRRLQSITRDNAWWSGRNYFGYCHAQHRALTDEEKIDAALSDALASYGAVASLYVPPGSKIIGYANKEEFLRVNRTGCCAIGDYSGNGQTVSPLDRLTGRISKFVIVKYIVRFRDANGNVGEKKAQMVTAISNCGFAWSGVSGD